MYHYKTDNANEILYQKKGIIYIDNLTKYAEYDTSYDMSKTPFIYNFFYGLQSGEARYNLSNGSKMRIVIEGSVKVEVDTNGDGEYELTDYLY